MTATWLVCGAGSLAEPKLPEIPGLDAFEGEILHSARWNHDLDLSGMRVALVGTGASAIQVVPGLAGRVKEMVVFQRTPAWVIPRRTTPYTKAQQRMFERAPQVMRRERDDIFWMAEAGCAARRAVPASLEVTRAQAEGNIARAISDESLRARLTPNYTPGCKRILSSNTYYPAFARDDAHLEDSALASVDGKVAVAASGNRYEVDAIVLCTGFETTEPPFAHQIIDANGRTLAESWHDGMAALDSTAVAGFPNLFTLVGPNTNLGHNSIIHMIESQVSYVLGATERAEREGLDWIMPSDEAQVAYVDSMQEQAAGTVWLRAGGCHSWYVDPRSGKLTQLWPDYAWDFRARNAHFTGDGFLTRTAGG